MLKETIFRWKYSQKCSCSLICTLHRIRMAMMPLKWWFINIFNIPNRKIDLLLIKRSSLSLLLFANDNKHVIEYFIQIAESEFFTVSRTSIYKINDEYMYIRWEESFFILLFSKHEALHRITNVINVERWTFHIQTLLFSSKKYHPRRSVHHNIHHSSSFILKQCSRKY